MLLLVLLMLLLPLQVDPARNLLFVRGQVPGPQGSFVCIRDAFRWERVLLVELTAIRVEREQHPSPSWHTHTHKT